MLLEVNSKVVVLYNDVKGKTEWNEDTIIARAENLAKVVADLFPIEQPVEKITFKDNKFEEYSCDYPENATYKIPNYYILQGEIVSISTFADMLKSIIGKLYELDPSVIENMARTNERVDGLQFSFEPFNEDGAYKLKNTEVYSYVSFSASHIMRIVKSLLGKYDIESEDFVYSARENTSSKEKFASGELQERNQLLLEYWTAFTEYAYKNETFVQEFGNRRSAQPQSWLSFATGKKRCSISMLAKTSKGVIGVEFYIDNNKPLFYSLMSKQTEIENVVGVPLQIAEATSDCRLFYEMPANISITAKWNEYFDWYIDMAIRFKKIADFVD